MDNNIKKRYGQLNFMSLIAMVMVANIHYLYSFGATLHNKLFEVIMYIIQSASLIAVPIFLIVTGYTYIYLEKEIDIKKIFLFVIVPAILFEQLQHYLLGWNVGGWTFSTGFIESWYGDLYVGVMIFIPLILGIKRKYPKFTWSILWLLALGGYALTLIYNSPNDNFLHAWVFIPYIGLIFVMTYFTFNTQVTSRSKLLLLMIPIIIFVAIFYTPAITESGYRFYAVRSYFCPIVVIYAIAFVKYGMTLDWNFGWVRNFSKVSYFFYFTHYLNVRILEKYFPVYPEEHFIIGYLFVLVGGFILAYVTYEIYVMIIKGLKI